jgi:hypothetical protein
MEILFFFNDKQVSLIDEFVFTFCQTKANIVWCISVASSSYQFCFTLKNEVRITQLKLADLLSSHPPHSPTLSPHHHHPYSLWPSRNAVQPVFTLLCLWSSKAFLSFLFLFFFLFCFCVRTQVESHDTGSTCTLINVHSLFIFFISFCACNSDEKQTCNLWAIYVTFMVHFMGIALVSDCYVAL